MHCRPVLVLASCTFGCVSSYRYPDPKDAGAAKVQSRTTADEELAVHLDVPRFEKQLFLDEFESYGKKTVEATVPPTRGRFVSVTVREVPNSAGEQLWGMLAVTTGFIIPAYSDTAGYDVSFDTAIDGEPARHYEYEARTTVWVWAGLAPFAWANSLTPSRDDAFSGVVRQFLADSFKDGF
jgi:hypothetical protein